MRIKMRTETEVIYLGVPAQLPGFFMPVVTTPQRLVMPGQAAMPMSIGRTIRQYWRAACLVVIMESLLVKRSRGEKPERVEK